MLERDDQSDERERIEPQVSPARAFQDLPREHGFEPLEVRGAVPDELACTLYRVGPALFQRFGKPYAHWFDGDGGVCAVQIGAGGARGAARIVRSRGYLYEEARGRPLTGGFASKASHLRSIAGLLGLVPMSKVVKNAANTSILQWQGRVFALWEAGRATEIDPQTLETVGETSFGGVVPGAFSAHPHRVPARRATYNFGVRFGPRTWLDIFELPDEGNARRLSTLKLPRPTLIHDFVATERHFVFALTPLHLRSLRVGLGMGGFADNLVWEPQRGTDVLVVPIDEPDRQIWLQTEPFWAWHYANGFERTTQSGTPTGELVLDAVRYPRFASRAVDDIAKSRERSTSGVAVWRALVDVRRRRVEWEKRWEHPCEFPRVHPQRWGAPYRRLWMAGHGDAETAKRRPWDRLVRLDPETGDATLLDLGSGRIPSEPLFVPRPGGRAEDEGWLLSLVYDPERHASFIAVIDAQRFEQGAIAELWLAHHIPPTLHGTVAGAPGTPSD